MFFKRNKVHTETFEEILRKYLNNGERPTKAVESALEEFNNSRSSKEGISISTAWRRYKKVKEDM